MVVGPYGSGKTFVLQWIMENEFRQRRVRPYFFDNPGVAFYDLANNLLRQVGRYELSKAMWELLYRTDTSSSLQSRLFELTFPQWLAQLDSRNKRDGEMRSLADAFQTSDLVDDEEVAFRFAQLVVDTRDRPYFQFRDFVPGSSRSVVAERQEARYFKALIRILQRVFDVDGLAFLIDEFEDVALGRRLGSRQIAEYTSTLRRLLDTADEEEFWLALSITPEGLARTRSLEPSLMERFGPPFHIPELSETDAEELVWNRLTRARADNFQDRLWPFQDDVISVIQPISRSIPRRLIKIFWQSLALATHEDVKPPIPNSLVVRAEQYFLDES